MPNDAVGFFGKACRFFSCLAGANNATTGMQRLGVLGNGSLPDFPGQPAGAARSSRDYVTPQAGAALRHNPIDVRLTLAEPVSVLQGNPSQRTYEAFWCGVPVHLHVLTFVKRPNPIAQLPGPTSPHATVAAALDAPPPAQANMLIQPDMVAVATEVEAALVQLIAEPSPQVVPVLACAKVTCRAHIGSPGDEHVTQRIIAEVHVVTPRVPGLVPLSQWLQERWPQCECGAAAVPGAGAEAQPSGMPAATAPVPAVVPPAVPGQPTASSPQNNKGARFGPSPATGASGAATAVDNADGALGKAVGERRDVPGPSALKLGASQPIAEGVTHWNHSRAAGTQHGGGLQRHRRQRQQQQQQQSETAVAAAAAVGLPNIDMDLRDATAPTCLPCLSSLFAPARTMAAGMRLPAQRDGTCASTGQEVPPVDPQTRAPRVPGEAVTAEGTGAGAAAVAAAAAAAPDATTDACTGPRRIVGPATNAVFGMGRQRFPLPPPPPRRPLLPLPEALEVLICLAEALQNLHRRGLTHGSLTPMTVQLQLMDVDMAAAAVAGAVAAAASPPGHEVGYQSLAASPGTSYPTAQPSASPSPSQPTPTQLLQTPSQSQTSQRRLQVAGASAAEVPLASPRNSTEATPAASPCSASTGASKCAAVGLSAAAGTTAASKCADSDETTAGSLGTPAVITAAESCTAGAAMVTTTDASAVVAGLEAVAVTGAPVAAPPAEQHTRAAAEAAEAAQDERRAAGAAAPLTAVVDTAGGQSDVAAGCGQLAAVACADGSPEPAAATGAGGGGGTPSPFLHPAAVSVAPGPSPARQRSLQNGRRRQPPAGAGGSSIRAMLSLPAVGPAVLQLQTWGRARPVGLPRDHLLWCAPELLNGGTGAWGPPLLARRSGNGSGSMSLCPLDQSLGCRTGNRLRASGNNCHGHHGRHFGDGSYGGSMGGGNSKRHRCATQMLMGQDPGPAAGSAYGVTPSCDVYSLGMLMWYLVTGQVPFQQLATQDVMRVKELGTLDEQLPFSPDLPQGYVQLARRCWAPLPMQRPAMKVVLSEMRSLRAQLLGWASCREAVGEYGFGYGGSSLGEMTADSRLSFTLSLPLSSRDLSNGEDYSLVRPPLELAFGANDAFGACGGGGAASGGGAGSGLSPTGGAPPPPPPLKSALPAALLTALTAPRRASVGGSGLMDDDDNYSDTDRFTEHVDTNDQTEPSGGGTPYSSPTTADTANGRGGGGTGAGAGGVSGGSTRPRAASAAAVIARSFRLFRVAGGSGAGLRPGSTAGSGARSCGNNVSRRRTSNSHASAAWGSGGGDVGGFALQALGGAAHTSIGKVSPALLAANRSFANRCASSSALLRLASPPSTMMPPPPSSVPLQAALSPPGASYCSAAAVAATATNSSGDGTAVVGGGGASSSKASGASLRCLAVPCGSGSGSRSD